MKHAYFVGLLAVSAGCLLGQISHAQDFILQKDTARNGAITFLRLATAGANRRAATDAGPALRSLLKLRTQDELRPQAAQADELGFTHTRHSQYYKGIPVEYGIYVVHARNGVIETLNGEVLKVGDLAVAPSLSEQVALSKALAAVGGTSGQALSAENSSPAASSNLNSKLLISRDATTMAGARLAYKFVIYTQRPIDTYLVYVDARSGEVFRKQSATQDSNAPGTATTRYSGNQAITTDLLGTGVYRLRETARGSGAACGSGSASIETYNANGAPPSATSPDITNNTNNWSNDAALDAHWAAEKTYDYFRNTFCRNSFDGAGATIKVYAHAGVNDNAYWDLVNKIAVLCDGADRCNAFTSLDVAGHEIAHGYTQFMVATDGSQAEPGAINEGLSDIWGSCVEYSAAPTKQTWLWGEDIMKSGFSCARNMANPNSGFDPAFTSTGGYPDRYQGLNYDSRTTGFDPHINSTIMSHCFYLLAVGGTGANSLGTNYSVTGLGIEKAAQLLFRAEFQGYITSTTNFAGARTAMINAATDLYGSCSVEAVAVANAWYAVGVGNSSYSGTPSTPSITASLLSASGEPTMYRFKVTNPPFGVSYDWYVNGSLYESTTINEFDYYFPCRVTKSITCVLNGCNSSSNTSAAVSRTGGCSRSSSQASYAYAPNPANDEVIVSAGDPATARNEQQSLATTPSSQSSLFTVQLYNNFGQLVRTVTSENGKVHLKLTDLPSGLYTLRAGIGSDALNAHIQVVH